ncbi:hypothetical protein [Pseudoroseicyclus aestuarii]|uniref:Lipoprotein n=1 Tax=Pseudoroseicyclus aestuarii TaxID=1795041 RepID=A0A318SWA1_9RHOB|nr:hypothetical protein [Pseudoroseicyclus aestuarii]PYE85645.1 hypothetical protein DFP88_101314 [Pseudoroseicyclus aestuarii]
MIRSLCAVGAALLLSACGGGGGGGSPEGPPDTGRSVLEDYSDILSRPITTDLPISGSAGYSGGIVTDFAQGGAAPAGRMTADLDIEVQFSPAEELPVEARLSRIGGSFEGQPLDLPDMQAESRFSYVAVDEAPLGGRRGGRLITSFSNPEAQMGGQTRRLDLQLRGDFRGPGGAAVAGEVTGTVLTPPFTPGLAAEPHVATGRFAVER